MRQIITLALAIVAFGAFISIAAGQTSTALRNFGYGGFARSDEVSFNVENTPVFGINNTMQMMFYDPYGNPDRAMIGAVWYKSRVLLDSFNVTFHVRMSNLSHTGVGNPDGFALVVQNSRANVFGPAYGGLGYGATPDYYDLGVGKSVAVEFDTYENQELNDPNSNHISVHTSSDSYPHNTADENNALNPPGPATDVPLIAGYTRKYNVQFAAKQLNVYIDDNTTPAYQGTVDVASVLGLTSAGAWVGITSSCYGTCEDIQVLDWYYNYVSVVDPTKSYVTSFKNTSVAGRTSSFIIQNVDSNGYLYQSGGDASKYSVNFTPVNITGTVGASNVIISDRGDGTYLVTYSPNTAGYYNVTVMYNSVALPNMPILLLVGPAPVDPTKSDVSGNLSGGVAGVVQNVTIVGKDTYGNVNMYNSPAATFTATFNNNGPSATSTFIGNGTYLIQYTLTTTNTYTMTVTYNSTTQQVKGSPFSGVTITPNVPAAATSTASNVGTQGGTAGVALPVTVVVRDTYGNNITTGMPAPYLLLGQWDKPAAGNNVTFMLNSDGTYGATYTVNPAGSYIFSVLLYPGAQPISRSPFAITVVPQTIASGAQSLAYGSGLLAAAAGNNVSFTVQARDAFGNNMTTSTAVISVSFSTSVNSYTATQNAPNSPFYTVSYIPTLSNTLRVTPMLDNVGTLNSPYSVNVQPGVLSPNNTFAGLGSVIPKLKVPLAFGVTAVDQFNNRLKTGGATIVATFKEMKSGALVSGTVQDMNNGEYNVAVTFTKAGIYNATITANGVPINNGQAMSVTVPSEGLGALGWTLIILAILALVVVVGGGAFWYLKYYKTHSEYDEIGA